MARRAHDMTPTPVVDIVADGMDDDEIAEAFRVWLDDGEWATTALPVTAAEELRAAHEAGEA